MKPRYFIFALSLLGVSAVFLLRKEPPLPPPPQATTTSTADGMSLTTETDPALVFQKAFWRRPTGDDQILHAERREWSTADGLQKWQWFIAVSPGPQLLEYLKTNPFSLSVTPSAGKIENPPVWFAKSAADFQIQQNSLGRFILMLSADGKSLYATDSGSGFAAPIATP